MLQYLLLSKDSQQAKFHIAVEGDTMPKEISLPSAPLSDIYPEGYFSPGGQYCAIPLKTGLLLWDVVSHTRKGFLTCAIQGKIRWNSDSKQLIFHQKKATLPNGCITFWNTTKNNIFGFEDKHNATAFSCMQDRLIAKSSDDDSSFYIYDIV